MENTGNIYMRSDNRNTGGLFKTYFAGLLESPVMPPHEAVDTVHYKIFITGKSGVGKTALVARLAGLDIPNAHYETTGGPSCFTSQQHVCTYSCMLAELAYWLLVCWLKTTTSC